MRGQTSVCMNLEKLEAGLKVRHGEELDGEEAHAADENTQERCVAAVLPNSPQEKLGHNREAVEKGEAAAAATTTTTTATTPNTMTRFFFFLLFVILRFFM